jgi:hypothetical protein
MALKAKVVTLTGWINSGKQQNVIGRTSRQVMALGAGSLGIPRA